MIEFTKRVLASVGFIFFGLVGWIEGEETLGEIWTDLKFLWGPGRYGTVYYGLQFDD